MALLIWTHLYLPNRRFYFRGATKGHLMSTAFSFSFLVYLTLLSCASAKPVQSFSDGVSSCLQEEYCFLSWTAGVLIHIGWLSKFRPVLYCIETNCAWRGTSESSVLSHPSCRRVLPAVCFSGFITPPCTIVHTLSSRKGTFYSPALVSDILTR